MKSDDESNKDRALRLIAAKERVEELETQLELEQRAHEETKGYRQHAEILLAEAMSRLDAYVKVTDITDGKVMSVYIGDIFVGVHGPAAAQKVADSIRAQLRKAVEGS